MKPIAVCLISVFLLAAPAGASLPNSFNGWVTKAARPIQSTQLPQIIGEDAPLLLEYGFVVGEKREYEKDGATLTVNLWQMADVSGSFGLFTSLREDGAQSVAGSEDRVAYADGRLLIQRGNHVVDARGERLALGDAGYLVTDVPAIRNEAELLPPLSRFVPVEDRVPQSDKYVMGPVAFERLETSVLTSEIGFEMGAEAYLARYRTGRREARLLLVSYPTPQMAIRKFRSFQALAAAAEEKIPMERKGSLICFAMGTPDEATAQALLDQVRYISSVTWNERVATAKDNIGNLVIASFWLTGFLLLFAFVAGISFGGARVLAKKFFRNPVFDRPSQVEIIQLNLYDR